MPKVHDVTTCTPNHGSTNGGTRVYFYGTFNPPAEASTRNFYQIRFDRDDVVPAVYEPEHHHLYCHTPPHSAAIAVTIEIKAEGEANWTQTPCMFDYIELNDVLSERPASNIPQVDAPASG